MLPPVRAALFAPLLLTLWLAGPASGQPNVTTDPAAAKAGAYTLDKAHSSVTMKVSHLGLSYATLRFDGVEGSYTYDPARPEATQLQVVIDANSVDTGDTAFSREIASQVFDSARFPQIRFASTSVRSAGEGRGAVVGDLSFHGVSRPATLDVIFNGAGQDEQHDDRMGFSATTVVRRSDFGVTKYLPAVGDDVSVMIEVEFTKSRK